MKPRRELHELLISLFSLTAFRRFIKYGESGEEVWNSASSDLKDMDSTVECVIDEFEQRGIVGDEFFNRLIKARRKRVVDILKVRQAWVSGRKPAVAIVDDERYTVLAFERMLNRYAWTTYGFVEGSSFLSALKKGQTEVDVAIVDINMPAITGIDVLSTVQKEFPVVSCIVLTSYCAPESVCRSFGNGALDFVERPILDWVRFMNLLNTIVGRDD